MVDNEITEGQMDVAIMYPVSLGQMLQSARAAKGRMTLEHVAAETCIPVYYLEAMEHDEYDKMPEGCYAPGFVKTYAEFVGLDAAALVQQYRAVTAKATPVEDQESPKTSGSFWMTKSSRFPLRNISLTLLAVMLLGGLAWFGPSTAPVPDVTASALTGAEEIPMVQLASMTVAKKPKSGRFQLVEKANAGSLSTLQSRNEMPISTDQLRIVAHEDTWLRISDGQEQLYINQILRRGEEFKAPPRADLMVSTSNLGALQFYRGDTLLKTTGEYGSIRQEVALNDITIDQ